jgi:adenylate cyclase
MTARCGERTPEGSKMSDSYIQWHDDLEQTHRRYLIDKLFIGRLCRGVDAEHCIQINQPSVSRDHAVIQATQFGIELTDLSTNGTWLNGVRMASGSSRGLSHGDVIEIGQVRLELVCEDDAPPRPEASWGDEQTTISPSIVWVTSLVADVRGFSAMCQSTDSDAAYNMMNEVFSRFSEIVTTFKGTVKDFAGDAVFAFWEHAGGMSAAQALLACRAAVEQYRQVNDIHATLGRTAAAVQGLRLGWGLTTGPATLSHYGVRHTDLALVGDAINLAFRLSAIADKEVESAIVLCRNTAELVRAEIDLIDLGDIRTKGRTGLERVYGIARI